MNLSETTKEQLVEELCKREGVLQNHIDHNEAVRMAFTCREKAHWYNGKARILVIKEGVGKNE